MRGKNLSRTKTDCQASPGETGEDRNGLKWCRVIIEANGIHVVGTARNLNPLPPPRREKGDILGWSRSSRVRMRQFLISHKLPDDLAPYAITLTVPPLRTGENLVAGQSECATMFDRFRENLFDRGACAVWRMEIQPRENTKRDDIRGQSQIHWHLLAGLPVGSDSGEYRKLWLRALRERGSVHGAVKHSSKVELCADYTSGQMRYMLDHASKRKQAQVADVPGRHWGVINRPRWVQVEPQTEQVSVPVFVAASRLVRRLRARRVPDKRATGGINWSVLRVVPRDGGCAVDWLGGSCFIESWNGTMPPPASVSMSLCRSLGIARKNTWALKLSYPRSARGFHFTAGAGRILEAAKIVVKLRKVKDRLEKHSHHQNAP